MTYSQVAMGNRLEGSQKKRKEKNKENELKVAADDTESDSYPEETVKADEVMATMQQRFADMEAQFEARFGKVAGTDIDTTKQLIEENNKVIQKASEAFFEKKFEELTTNLTKEIQRSNDIIFTKFAALHDQQNT